MGTAGHAMSPPPCRARLTRGFRRVGIVLASVMGVIGVTASLLLGMGEASSRMAEFDRNVCMLRKLEAGELVRSADSFKGRGSSYSENGCPGSFFMASDEKILSAKGKPRPRWIGEALWAIGPGLALTAALAGILHLSLWGLGWIASGFMRD